MIIKITRTGQVTQVQPQVVRIVRVYDHPVPAGILETAYTQKGGVLAGTGPGTYAEHAPGSSGQYLSSDPSSPTGLIWTTPRIAITDATNFLTNWQGSFLKSIRRMGCAVVILELPRRWL